MEKNVEISILLDLYGKLLTQKQFNILDDYYNNDLSLSEIAENNEITRQAVRDVIKKSENKLLDYEKKLGFMEKTLKQKEITEKMIEQINSLKENLQDLKSVKTLEKVERELNYFA